MLSLTNSAAYGTITVYTKKERGAHMRTEKLLTVTAILCRSLEWFPVCILMLSLRA